MIKFIWSKNELPNLEEQLHQQGINYLFLNHIETLPDHMVGIEIDDLNKNEIKKVIDLIEYEKMQMFFPAHDGFVQLCLKDILYIEAFGDDIIMHLSNQDIEHIKTPLYQLESLLKPFRFIRISKSYIVNVRKIRYIKVALNAKLNVELKDGHKLDVTRSYVKSFKKSLNL